MTFSFGRYTFEAKGTAALVTSVVNSLATLLGLSLLPNAVSAQQIDSASQHNESQLQEVLVTAQKKTENAQDVPVPLTSVPVDALAESNQTRVQDYVTSIPGLSVAPVSPSVQFLSIRGISTGTYTNPTVAVVIDDVPIGSSTNLGGGYVVPDIDPADLSHIEVLRGPQGTLYGASSLGGLFKFVTADPSPNAFSGRAQVDAGGVHNGGQPDYTFRGAVNAPITDAFAVRISAFARQDAGYIDDPTLETTGVNRARTYGARLSALWEKSKDFSIKLSALYQDSLGDGNNDVDIQPGLGDLQQSYPRGVGRNHRTLQAYAATIHAVASSIDITSVTGYSINRFSDSQDYTQVLGTYSEPQFGTPTTPLAEANATYKFTQELRLSMPLGERFDWLVGGFYTHEDSTFINNLFTEQPATGAFVGQWLYLSSPTTYEEYAGFTDFTIHFTDSFDIQLGGRESHIRQSSSEVNIGPYDEAFLGQASPVILPNINTDSNSFTYLVTPRVKLNPAVMLYARLASGYRAGGLNAAPGSPREYQPDKTQNYEIGLKADLFDRTVSIDSSVYRIDWKDIQVSLLDPNSGFGYYANSSRAKSQGVELSASASPLTGLNFGGWITWGEAILTRDFPALSAANGFAGDPLPYSSRFSAKVSVADEFALTNTLRGFCGAAVSYVGNRRGDFTALAFTPRPDLPAYAKTDLHFGVKQDRWTTSFYVNNLFDRRGLLLTGQGESLPYAYIYIRPRSYGMSVTYNF